MDVRRFVLLTTLLSEHRILSMHQQARILHDIFLRRIPTSAYFRPSKYKAASAALITSRRKHGVHALHWAVINLRSGLFEAYERRFTSHQHQPFL